MGCLLIVNESRGDPLAQTLSPGSPFEEFETPNLGSLPRDRFSLERLSDMAPQHGRSTASHKQILPFPTRPELQIFSIVTLLFPMWWLRFFEGWGWLHAQVGCLFFNHLFKLVLIFLSIKEAEDNGSYCAWLNFLSKWLNVPCALPWPGLLHYNHKRKLNQPADWATGSVWIQLLTGKGVFLLSPTPFL